MEYFDVYNHLREPLGYTKERGIPLNENEYNIGAELWIINNGKILMTQRSLNKSHPGEWEVPGGCSQKGETTIMTIIRELSEEIGICINKKDILLIGTILYKKQFVDIYFSKIDINLEETNLQENEVQNIQLISIDKFNEMNKENKIVKSVYNRSKLVFDFIKD